MSTKARLRVVVDGSNLATEGRTTPSLTQLDEAVTSFLAEYPGAEVIVVADASFEHRVAPNERARFTEAMLNNEIVTPPAGAIGRGDAFILKIADRIGGVVLSNDSFQEFQSEYPWLFEEGRLIGGKPVMGVGWVFTVRLPVRGVKALRETRKLAVTLKDGAKPTIGTTLTPVKKTAKKVEAPKKAAKKVAAVAKKATKKVAKVADGKTDAVKKVAKKVEAPKKVAKKVAAVAKKPVKKVAKAPVPTTALRRDRQPVNPEADFALFKSAHRLGAKLEGEVTAFTSHGAVIKVTLKNGSSIECYAPNSGLGSPAPQRARDVLTRGDKVSFKLVTVDAERRIAELSLL